MEGAVPFAAILTVFAVFAWSVWPQQILLAIALVIAAALVLVLRAVELS